MLGEYFPRYAFNSFVVCEYEKKHKVMQNGDEIKKFLVTQTETETSGKCGELSQLTINNMLKDKFQRDSCLPNDLLPRDKCGPEN